MRRALVIGIAVIAVELGGVYPPAMTAYSQAEAGAPFSAFAVGSPPGSFSGAGQAYYFTPANSTITSWNSLPSIELEAMRPNRTSVTARMSPPARQTFGVGSYETVGDYDGVHARMTISGDGLPCSGASGNLTIYEISSSNNTLTSLAATYIVHCDSGVMFGDLRYHSTIAALPLSATPNGLLFFDQLVNETSGSQTLVLTNNGDTSLSPSAVLVEGQHAGDFDIVTDHCSGSTIPPAGTCDVAVTFSPTALGYREALLQVVDNALPGQRAFVLRGRGPTLATFNSQPGDWVGDGQRYAFSPTDAEFLFNGGRSGLSVWLREGNARRAAISLTKPSGSASDLAVGSYRTHRFPDVTHGALDVGSENRGCNESTGSVTIHEISFNNEKMQSLAATYLQHCEGVPASLFGEVRYNSSIGLLPISAAPLGLTFPHRTINTTGQPKTITVKNEGASSLTPDTVLILGPDAASFKVTMDGCTASAIAPGATCDVAVAYTPTNAVGSDATLHIADSAIPASQDLALHGKAFAPALVTLTPSASGVIFGKRVALTAHLDDFTEMANPVLKISATSTGAPKRTLYEGRVNANGDLTITHQPISRTVYSASFVGDQGHAAATSAGAAVAVRPIVTTTTVGGYGSSGAARLYHYTEKCPASRSGCPVIRTTVKPNLKSQTVCLQLQIYRQRAWQPAGCPRFALDARSSLVAILLYKDRSIVSQLIRVRGVWSGSAAYLTAQAPWAYLKVTN